MRGSHMPFFARGGKAESFRNLHTAVLEPQLHCKTTKPDAAQEK